MISRTLPCNRVHTKLPQISFGNFSIVFILLITHRFHHLYLQWSTSSPPLKYFREAPISVIAPTILCRANGSRDVPGSVTNDGSTHSQTQTLLRVSFSLLAVKVPADDSWWLPYHSAPYLSMNQYIFFLDKY